MSMNVASLSNRGLRDLVEETRNERAQIGSPHCYETDDQSDLSWVCMQEILRKIEQLSKEESRSASPVAIADTRPPSPVATDRSASSVATADTRPPSPVATDLYNDPNWGLDTLDAKAREDRMSDRAESKPTKKTGEAVVLSQPYQWKTIRVVVVGFVVGVSAHCIVRDKNVRDRLVAAGHDLGDRICYSLTTLAREVALLPVALPMSKK